MRERERREGQEVRANTPERMKRVSKSLYESEKVTEGKERVCEVIQQREKDR